MSAVRAEEEWNAAFEPAGRVCDGAGWARGVAQQEGASPGRVSGIESRCHAFSRAARDIAVARQQRGGGAAEPATMCQHAAARLCRFAAERRSRPARHRARQHRYRRQRVPRRADRSFDRQPETRRGALPVVTCSKGSTPGRICSRNGCSASGRGCAPPRRRPFIFC